jgi:hypothetical protein
MRLLQVWMRSEDDATCLVRELAVYSPRRRRSALLLELPDDQAQAYLLGLLAAIEACLRANDMSCARIELDGKQYLLEARV